MPDVYAGPSHSGVPFTVSSPDKLIIRSFGNYVNKFLTGVELNMANGGTVALGV